MNEFGQDIALVLVLDDVPDDNPFVVSTFTPWFVDIVNYLGIGRLPQNLSNRENHNIVQRSANYSWIDGDLFHTKLDLIMRRCV